MVVVVDGDNAEDSSKGLVLARLDECVFMCVCECLSMVELRLLHLLTSFPTQDWISAPSFSIRIHCIFSIMLTHYTNPSFFTLLVLAHFISFPRCSPVCCLNSSAAEGELSNMARLSLTFCVLCDEPSHARSQYLVLRGFSQTYQCGSQ